MMKIVIDENKKITAYAVIGDLENAIEITDFEFDNKKIGKYYYLNNEIVTLKDGQYIKDDEIIEVEKPSKGIEYIWDSTYNIWKLKYTKEELMSTRKEKILKYAELKKEIQILNELASEFESSDTIEMLEGQMKELKEEINRYAEQIEQLKQ